MNTLLVTAYTPGYADLARRLEDSVYTVAIQSGHPLDLWAMPYESTGSWERNGHVKPRALLEAMRQHPGRPVCWVDADAILRAPPVLLDSLPRMTDVAWHVVPKTREDLSGTVWVNQDAGRFLTAWAEALRGSDMWDQRAIRAAAKACAPICTQELPAEYCWIDYMAEPRWGGPRVPVIEHTQASRDVRAGKRAM